jgi:hypothetical protein
MPSPAPTRLCSGRPALWPNEAELIRTPETMSSKSRTTLRSLVHVDHEDQMLNALGGTVRFLAGGTLRATCLWMVVPERRSLLALE